MLRNLDSKITVSFCTVQCVLLQTLNKHGFFGHLKAGGISLNMLLTSFVAIFQSNHSFMVSNENLVPWWSINLIIYLLCWIVLPRCCLEVSYFCTWNLLVLDRKIFENPKSWSTCTICTSNESWKHTKGLKLQFEYIFG